jgi:hypothetical protein
MKMTRMMRKSTKKKRMRKMRIKKKKKHKKREVRRCRTGMSNILGQRTTTNIVGPFAGRTFMPINLNTWYTWPPILLCNFYIIQIWPRTAGYTPLMWVNIPRTRQSDELENAEVKADTNRDTRW